MAQWKQEAILNLISAYRAKRLLWDHKTPEYTNRNKRIEAWKDIANEVGHDVMMVERKLKSLKTHFMAVHKAYARRRLKAESDSIIGKPKWFAYEALTFLIKGRAPRDNREALNMEKHQNSASVSDWKSQVIYGIRDVIFSQFQQISLHRDEFTVFAEHVAIRLKNITDIRARLIAQHQINNILFEAEMGKYNMHSYNSELMENLDEPSTSNDEKTIISLSHKI